MKSQGECRILIERNHKQASVGGHHFSLSRTDFDFFALHPPLHCVYVLPLCQLQLRWSSSTFNAPHMNVIRVSAHREGLSPSGLVTVWIRVRLQRN